MNLQKINNYISAYIKRLEDPHYDGLVLWELAYQFQQHWSVDIADFRMVYSQSFAINSPLWNRDNYIPKKMMERYININVDLACAMFKDLLNESKDISGRIGRFIFQCDEYYKMDRADNQQVLPHDHDDMKMIFIYLAFCYPEKYTLYNFPAFKKFMMNIGSAQVMTPQDIGRFVKVCRTISALAQKNERLMALVEKKIKPITGEEFFPMLLVYEIYTLDVFNN